MNDKLVIRASIVTLVGATLIGCGASLEEYQKFATAGKEYATALDTLLVTSGNYFVDANSERLLRTDLQEPEIDRKNYSDITKNDDEWLGLIGRMRLHTNLIKNYFFALENLATSDAPEEAKKATDGIFTQLNEVSNTIQSTPLISNEVGSALANIPKIILSQKIKGALRAELEQRKDAIYREIVLQEYLLKFLALQLQKNLAVIRDNRDNRLVLPAYIDSNPISDPNLWIKERRDLRTMNLSIEALNNASQAAASFKEAFQLLLADKFTVGRANAILSDVDYLLDIAEELKQKNNKQKEN